MATMKSFHTTKCYHLVGEHEASVVPYAAAYASS